MQTKYYKFILGCLVIVSLLGMTSLWAARAVDLRHQPQTFMHSMSAMAVAADNTAQPAFKIISSNVDKNHTTHTRIQQTYQGYNVWGGAAVMHVPNSDKVTNVTALHQMVSMPRTTMTGTIYEDLAADLHEAPSYIFGAPQADKALQQAIQLYEQQTATKNPVTQTKTTLQVYVDENNKAHWAYLVSFKFAAKTGMPARPVFIMDATTFNVYQQWNDVKTLSDVEAGGYGGNDKMGRMVYDGVKNDFPKLTMERNNLTKTCYVENDEVTVEDRRKSDSIVNFKCIAPDSAHQEYWDDSKDEVNGAFSPSNDALYAGKMVKALYQDWYQVPVLVDMSGDPMMLIMRVHEYMDNAYWDGEQMTFGDGISDFYPLVSLGVAAHEISHGFTAQHAGLFGNGPAGGLNEAFSDMAAQALEFYATKHNSWQIGGEITKAPDSVLRYMDEPTKDCEPGNLPGVGCSISNAKDYYGKLDVHYSCGVFNKFFYLLATSNGWDVKKAFDVMVQANINYWTYNTSFISAACDVVTSAGDLGYDAKAVNQAAAAVGLDTTKC
jgi:pseudolysin